MIRYGLRGTERDFFHFPGGHCDMVIDRQQEMLFVLLEQTPSERRHIRRSPRAARP